MLVPPKQVRKFLSEPIGPLIKGESIKKHMEATRKTPTITIGDEVTRTYMDILGELPFIAVVDGKTRRGEKNTGWLEQLKKAYKYNYIEITNPPGGIIKEELMEKLGEIELNFISMEKTLVIVEGEEDLLALFIPLLLFKDKEFQIIYGQPGEGIVLLQINKDTISYLITIIQSMNTFIGDYKKAINLIKYSGNESLENKC